MRQGGGTAAGRKAAACMSGRVSLPISKGGYNYPPLPFTDSILIDLQSINVNFQ